MKKYHLLYIMMSFLFIGCNQGSKTNNQQEKGTEKSIKGNTSKIIHRDIIVAGEFTHITSVSGANIVFTPGDYKIEAVGDSSYIQYINTDFDSGILTLSLGSERNPDLNVYEGKTNITINISAPNLKCVSLCSSGDFISKGIWKGEKIELGIIGNGEFLCDSILCQDFDFKSSHNGNAKFAHIKANNINFTNLGNSNIKANIDTDHLFAINRGKCTFSFTGRATTHELYPTKEGKILFK